MRRAMRSSPIYPAWYLNILGFGHYQCGQYDEAERILKLALQRQPAYSDCRLILAAAYQARGRTNDAAQEAHQVLHHEPEFRLKQLEARLAIVKDRKMLAGFLDVLRQLGLE